MSIVDNIEFVKENAFVKVLKISAFRNLWLSQVFSQVFLNVLFFSLIIQVYQLTRSNTAVSIMVIMTIVPNILLGAFAGVLVDRWDRKAVMFFSHFLRVFVVLLFLISSETIVWIYVLAALVGVITQFFFPAEGATIPEVVKDRRLLLSANSLFTLTFFASVVVGNVFAGPLLRAFGAHPTFLIVAGAFLISSVFTAKLPGIRIWKEFVKSRHKLLSNELWKLSDKHGPREGLLQNFMEGLDFIHRNKIVKLGIFYMAVGQGMIAILGGIAPGFADRILGLSATEVSVLVMAPAAFGMIIGGAIVGQFLGGINKLKLVKTGLFGASILLLLFSQVDRLNVVLGTQVVATSILILIVLGIFNSLMDIPVNTLVQENTPEEVRSRIYGVIGTMIGSAAIIPVLFSGTIADSFGVRTVMLMGGAVLLAVWLFSLKRVHVPNSN